MNHRVKLYVILAVVVSCIVTLGLSTSVGQDRRAYETQTQVYGISAGRSDAARAIDAYESLMQRYMDTTERNFSTMTSSLDALARKLDAIDTRLTSLDTRLTRIEQRLGINAVATIRDPNALPMPTSPGATLQQPAATGQITKQRPETW